MTTSLPRRFLIICCWAVVDDPLLVDLLETSDQLSLVTRGGPEGFYFESEGGIPVHQRLGIGLDNRCTL